MKCYFGTSTSTSCIQCVRNSAECSGREKHAGSSSPPKPIPTETSALSFLLKYHNDLNYQGDTPLKRAVAVGAYTREEAENMYTLFKDSSMSLISDLYACESISELDSTYPQLAIAIVSVVAMATSLPNLEKQRNREFFIDQIWGYSRSDNSLDTFLALAAICTYHLPYGQLGVSHIFSFYGLMISMTMLTESQSDLVNRVYTSVTVPYAFLDSFRPISKLIPTTGALTDNDSVATHLLRSYYEFVLAAKEIHQASTTYDAIEKYEYSMAVFFKSQASNYEVTALRIFYFLVRLKLMKTIAVKVCTSSNPNELSGFYRCFLERVIAETNILGYRLCHVFDIHSVRSVFPSFAMFLIEDALVNFLAIRFVAFAGNIDVDVKTEEFLRDIETKWSELAKTSSTARKGFVSFLTARVLSGLKIGVLSDDRKTVSGSGILPCFEIYSENDESHSLQFLGKCTSSEAQQILHSLDSNLVFSSYQNPCQSLTNAGYTFLREILCVYLE